MEKKKVIQQFIGLIVVLLGGTILSASMLTSSNWGIWIGNVVIGLGVAIITMPLIFKK